MLLLGVENIVGRLTGAWNLTDKIARPTARDTPTALPEPSGLSHLHCHGVGEGFDKLAQVTIGSVTDACPARDIPVRPSIVF
jgi:hypothetical protein